MEVLRLLFFFLLLPLTANAEIFVWKTPDGATHYSDHAVPGSERLPVTPGYSYYAVSKVYDGDTLLLRNGLKVRLTGINTPEVEGRHKAAEPGGDAAKIWLSEILAGKKVRLQTDLEKKDKYGRTLAHVFTEDRLHVNVELVKRGLATVSIYPPNLEYVDQLLLAQQQAEAQNRGLWQLEAYRPIHFESLNQNNYTGWHRVFGRATAVRNGRKYSFLWFSPYFEVGIDKKFLALFPDLKYYTDKRLEVRGWLSRKQQHFTMFIRHPSAIKILQ